MNTVVTAQPIEKLLAAPLVPSEPRNTVEDAIEDAIHFCMQRAEWHQKKSRANVVCVMILLSIIAAILLGSIGGEAYMVYHARLTADAHLNSSASSVWSDAVKILIPFAVAIFTFVFSVLMSVYRFHLHEKLKFERQAFGLKRLLIAGLGSSDGFGTTVREALVTDAFRTDPASFGMFSGRKDDKIESPLPGHPTSDLATALINKMLESIEFKASPRKEERAE